MCHSAFWDVFMDFSLLQPHSRHRFLRDVTALKYRWPYYLILIVDPLLRFNWIFYAIFTHDAQHSSIASFLIGFAEVTRRGMWMLLRVENEHCANVKQSKASRDVPLPYHYLGVDDSSHRTSADSSGAQRPGQDDLVRSPSVARVSWTGAVARTHSARSTGVDVSPQQQRQQTPTGASAAEEGRTPGEESFRLRRRADTAGKKSIRGMLADAHKQDFEKKRKPESGGRGGGEADGAKLIGEVGEEDEDDDDEDDDDDVDLAAMDLGEAGTSSETMLDERAEVREAEVLSGMEGRANTSQQ